MWSRLKGLVGNVRELLLQLQIVQNEAVAVVGYAEAVRGLAIGSSTEVGADPGCQPGARAKRGVYPVQVAAPVCREEAIGDSDLIDGSLASLCRCRDSPRSTLKSLLPSCGCPRRSSSFFSLGSHLFGERWVAGLLRRRCSRRCFQTSRLSAWSWNSFWPSNLSAAPIGFSFQCKTLFEVASLA